MKCHNCGKELTDGGFCIYCGFPREEKNRASSGKLYYAVAALVACFSIIAAFLIIRIGHNASSKLLEPIDNGELVAAQSDDYSEHAASEEPTVPEEREAEAESREDKDTEKPDQDSKLNDYDIIQKTNELFGYLADSKTWEDASKYVLDSDYSLRTEWESLRKEKGHFEYYEPVILANVLNEYLLYVVGYKTDGGAGKEYSTHILHVVATENGELLLAQQSGESYENLKDIFKQDADNKAREQILAYFKFTENYSFLSCAEPAIYNDANFKWLPQNATQGFDSEIGNMYYVFSSEISESGIISVKPICVFYSEFNGMDFVLLFIENGTESPYDISLKDSYNEESKWIIPYKTTQPKDFDSNNNPDLINEHECKFRVCAIPSRTDTASHEYYEISVVDATNESSD